MTVFFTGLCLATISGAAVAQHGPAKGEGSQIGTEPSLAVIEVYVKGTDAPAAGDYSRSLGFSLGSTGLYAVMERDEVGSRFRTVLTTPLKRLQADRLESIERLVREGDQLVYTDPKAAVEVLNRARTELEAIAEGLAANENLRREFLRAHMLMARAHLDSGNEVKAGEILREVIRVYGESIEVTERDYHPRVVKLFNKVLKGMNDEKKATLSVETHIPGCETVLDGRVLQGRTPTDYKGLYVGVHHVQVRCGDKESMIRRVALVEGNPVHLSVDVEFENSLTVEGGRLGLSFESPAEAAKNVIAYAAKLGSLVNADMVTVHGFFDPGPRSELKAWLVDVKQVTELKNAQVTAKTDVVTPSSVKFIVQKLSGRENVDVAFPVQPGSRHWYHNYWAWGLCGLGVAGVVTGGVFTANYLRHKANLADADVSTDTGYAIALSERDKALSSRTWMWVSYGIGGAALAGGVVWFILTEKSRPSTSDRPAPRWFAAPTPLPGGGGVAGTLRF
jgi:hypothetical protein